MGSKLIRVPITTDENGDDSVETSQVSGYVDWVRYVKPASNDLDANWDLDIVGSKTGVVVMNKDNITAANFTDAPRHATHDTGGVASVYTSDDEPVEARVFITGEALTVTVADGGNAQSGTIYIAVADA